MKNSIIISSNGDNYEEIQQLEKILAQLNAKIASQWYKDVQSLYSDTCPSFSVGYTNECKCSCSTCTTDDNEWNCCE